MGIKDIKDFSAEEVGMWFAAQGLDPSKVVSEGVDGDLLLSLSDEDLKNDLGLSGLQTKKVMKNIEFSKEQFAKVEGGDGDEEEMDKLRGDMEAVSLEKSSLEEKISELKSTMASKDEEIAELKKQMEEMKIENEKSKEVAVEKAAPAPQPAPAPRHHRGPGVVGGAARGAAGGAMKGAIAGAILPGMDAGDGAKAGAAVGATTGGLRGIRGRRAARRGF